jgi:hypothetical protein
MDISKLSNGSKLVLGGGILALIISFFHWQNVDTVLGSAHRSEWHGWGFLAVIVLLIILAWELSALFGMRPSLPVSSTIVTVLLAGLLILLTLLKVLVDNEFRTFWAWLGLILAVIVGAGAWLEMQAAGETFADVKSTVTSAASNAAAAARSAADSGDAEGSTATPAAPTAPAPPATPPAPPPPAAETGPESERNEPPATT